MDARQISEMVRFHRKIAQLSQVELAHLAGVGKTVIFDIEKGKLSVQLDTLLKVLKVLNIKLDFQSPLMSLFKERMVKRAKVFVDGKEAGELQEVVRGKEYRFVYLENYKGSSVSLTMPTTQLVYEYDRFPPFFEGLLPEGMMLEGLLRRAKIDRDDLFRQLIQVGENMVGNVTVEAI